MKKGFNILLILCAVLAVVSCNKYKTYTDMLNDQKKAIERFLDAEGIEVLSDFPKEFKENQFVKLKNGVYLNVIDSGNGERAEFNKTEVFCRFSARSLLRSDSVWFDIIGPNSGDSSPFEFKYGQILVDQYSLPELKDYLSPGLTSALEYVGNNSYVKMIVPFNNVGSFNQSSNGHPIYYKKVKFYFK